MSVEIIEENPSQSSRELAELIERLEKGEGTPEDQKLFVSVFAQTLEKNGQVIGQLQAQVHKLQHSKAFPILMKKKLRERGYQKNDSLVLLCQTYSQ